MKKNKIIFFILIAFVANVACTNQSAKTNVENRTPSPVKYENELLSIQLPEGWEYDASGWNGLDSMRNEVDFYHKDSPVWFHVVKTFLPIQWKNIDEAAQMALMIRSISGEPVALYDRVDSLEISGYPTTLLCFANSVDNDTIIQKQFVTYLQDSHIVMYFNENFYFRDWDWAQEIGDRILENIVLKQVFNPLDNVER